MRRFTVMTVVAPAFSLVACGPSAPPPAPSQPVASAPAKPSAPSVADLVDARGSSGESELTQRGYTRAKTQGLTTFWWHPAGACVKVATANGRYRVVENVANASCGH